MKDYDSMWELDMDTCPVHDAELKKEYDFGTLDAKVYKWECGCCGCTVGDMDQGTYHTDYGSACGRARLAVARAKVWW